MIDRIGVRLTTADREHLLTVAAALNTPETPGALPWQRGATITRAISLALAIAADAVKRGGAGTFLPPSAAMAGVMGT